MAKGTLSDSEKKMLDSVMGLVLFAVAIGLLAWGFLTGLEAVLPALNTWGAEIVMGALVFGVSVAVFKIRV